MAFGVSSKTSSTPVYRRGTYSDPHATEKRASRVGGYGPSGTFHGFGASGGGGVSVGGLGGAGGVVGPKPGGGGGGGGYGGGYGGGVPVTAPAPKFQQEGTPYMKEVMEMYRDLLAQNRDLAGQYDIEDILNKQRAEGSIQMREAEAMAGRTGGMSAAERRNIMMDQFRGLGETRGAGERSKLEFERALLGDMGRAIGGAAGLAGTEGDFMNQVFANQIRAYDIASHLPLEKERLAIEASKNDMQFINMLAALV